MKLAIMQPYYFPYIGYFELMASVEVFVFLTDVQFIRRGWVNRNRLRASSKPFQYLTIPVKRCPQKTPISQIEVIPGWHEDHQNVLAHTFSSVRKHPLYQLIGDLGRYSMLSDALCYSLFHTARHLGITCRFAFSENISNNHGQQRIIDICRHFQATEYFNLSGGRELYSENDFEEVDIQLRFMPPTKYGNTFSILDSVFDNERSVQEHLSSL